jgi:hypothetical protein
MPPFGAKHPQQALCGMLLDAMLLDAMLLETMLLEAMRVGP